MEIKIGGKVLETTVKYKNRKSLQISITSEGKLIVSAPFGLSEERIGDILKSKEDLLKKRLSAYKNYTPPTGFGENSGISFLGKNHEINLVENSKIPKIKIELKDFQIFLSFNPSIPQNLRKDMFEENLKKWILEKAYFELDQRMKKYSKSTGFLYRSWRLKDQKTRWGSCSSKKNISLNWRIVMAPEKIVDYVIIHELCHLKHLNHSKEYWDLVKKFTPDYLSSKKWLRENGHLLKLNFEI